MAFSPSHIRKTGSADYEQLLYTILVESGRSTHQAFHAARNDYKQRLAPCTNQELPAKPTTVNIELVNKCNYRCAMCYTVNHEGQKNILSFSTVRLIVDQCNELGVFTLMIGMGSEATLHPDLIPVLTYAASRIPDVVLFTNGSRLTASSVKSIIETGVTRVCISLDAASEDTYNTIRGGVLSQVENVINLFMTNKDEYSRPLTRVSFCEQDLNRHETSDFIAKWTPLVDSVEIQTVRQLDTLESLELINSQSTYTTFHNSNFCFRPSSYLTVWSDGKISPCCSFHGTKLELGNIYRDSLASAWNCELLRRIRDEFRNQSLNPVCSDCMSNTFDNP